MRYQTYHNPCFTLSSIFKRSNPISLSLCNNFQFHLILPSVVKEMEQIESALKSRSRKDSAMKLCPPAFIDDLLAVSVQNAVSVTDDFSVDDLLDLPNDDGLLDEEETLEKQNPLEQPEGFLVSSDEPQDDEHSLRRSTDLSAGDDFSVPAEDLADLEWLSHFVEDSFSEQSVPYLSSEKPSWLTGVTKQPAAAAADGSCLTQTEPANKRARTAGGRVWFHGSTPLTDSSSSSTSTSSTTSPSSPWLLPGGSELLEAPTPAKSRKSKKKSAISSQQTLPRRRCSHCGVQKTPQWRAGPMGAKTLCNACGVRYKSGRLLPEYRPACSPSFSSEIHSNSHRKVVEMRRKKETMVVE